jgi:hypothetical protein
MVNNGTIEGFVYWDTSVISHVPAGDCSGLAVTVAMAQSSAGPYTSLATLSDNFKYVGQVKQSLVGGKIKVYDVCTYGYDKVPVGPDLRVTVNVTSPTAFSPISVPQNSIVSPINIINAQCNMLPRIVNPTASDLFSKWGTCQNMAFDVNFEITKAPQFLSSSGGVQRGTSGTQVERNPGPAIVRLTPAQNTCRIIGATQGKEDARSSPAADWQIYSHFLEERVATKAEKLGAGKYKVSPASEIAPGEYALVLRPTSKTKNYSGGDVARAQGDGLMFDAVWTFQISEDAE